MIYNTTEDVPLVAWRELTEISLGPWHVREPRHGHTYCGKIPRSASLVAEKRQETLAEHTGGGRTPGQDTTQSGFCRPCVEAFRALHVEAFRARVSEDPSKWSWPPSWDDLMIDVPDRENSDELSRRWKDAEAENPGFEFVDPLERLIGGTIVRALTAKETASAGFEFDEKALIPGFVVQKAEEGHGETETFLVWVLRDPEGNGPGWLEVTAVAGQGLGDIVAGSDPARA